MANGPRYFVPFRRRREGKTDYYQRLKLLASDKPRMVVRRTNRQIIIQLVEATLEGDLTLVAAYSQELESLGYTGAKANTPAAYLTGILFAKKAIAAGYEEAILDIGLHRATPGARVFAALKGAVKGGMDIPFGEKVLPSDDRVRGVHIAEYDSERAANLPEMVDKVADAIMKEEA